MEILPPTYGSVILNMRTALVLLATEQLQCEIWAWKYKKPCLVELGKGVVFGKCTINMHCIRIGYGIFVSTHTQVCAHTHTCFAIVGTDICFVKLKLETATGRIWETDTNFTTSNMTTSISWNSIWSLKSDITYPRFVYLYYINCKYTDKLAELVNIGLICLLQWWEKLWAYILPCMFISDLGSTLPWQPHTFRRIWRSIKISIPCSVAYNGNTCIHNHLECFSFLLS